MCMVRFQFGIEGWQQTGVKKSTIPFQAFGAAIQNARLAVSVRVHGTERRGASVDRKDRVVNWCCRSSSMYGGTEVDKALCVVTAILYWMRCWTGRHWRDCKVYIWPAGHIIIYFGDCNSGWAWTDLRCWQMTRATLFWALCSLSTTATRAPYNSELQ